MFALRLVARAARPLLPIHDVSTAYDGPHLPQFIDDRRPGGWVGGGACLRLTLQPVPSLPLPLPCSTTQPHPPLSPQLVGAVKLLYFDVRPLVVESPDTVAVYAAALEAARAMGWEVAAEEAPTRFQAVATTRCGVGGDASSLPLALSTIRAGSLRRNPNNGNTPRLVGFKDDIAVRVSLDEAGARCRVDARSRSRVGQGDVGANGRRLAAYLGRLEAALAGRGLAVAARV
jgi:hypothetical protein